MATRLFRDIATASHSGRRIDKGALSFCGHACLRHHAELTGCFTRLFHNVRFVTAIPLAPGEGVSTAAQLDYSNEVLKRTANMIRQMVVEAR